MFGYVVKAHGAEDKLAKTMFLPLAEKMTLKYVDDDKIEAEAGNWKQEGCCGVIFLQELRKRSGTLYVLSILERCIN